MSAYKLQRKTLFGTVHMNGQNAGLIEKHENSHAWFAYSSNFSLQVFTWMEKNGQS